MEQNKEKLGVAIITAVYEVNGRKCCDEVKMGIACAKDFNRKERKNSQTFSQNGIKNVLQILLSVRKKIMQN